MRQKVKKSVSILPEGEEKIILEILNFSTYSHSWSTQIVLFYL